MPEALPEVDSILHSGALAYGKWGHEFEKKLGEYIGNNQILATNSFNAAYQVAITTLGVKFPQTGKDSSKRGEIILCLSHGIPLTSA